MTSPVVVVAPETTVKQAAALLVEHGFTALPVVSVDDQLVGMVTEADLMRDRVPRDPRARIHPGAERADGPVTTAVGEVMTTPAVAMGAGTDVAVLARVLLERHQRAMPIVDGSRLVGIVTRRDIIRTVARDDETIAVEVRRKLEAYGGDGRWRVEVSEGVVTIGDQHDNETDRHVAVVIAEAVPGVVRAFPFGPAGGR